MNGESFAYFTWLRLRVAMGLQYRASCNDDGGICSACFNDWREMARDHR